MSEVEKKKLWEKAGPSLFINIESGIYYVRKFNKKQGVLFESLRTNKKGLARTRADLRIADWLKGGKSASKERTISDLCDELEKLLEKDFENGDRRLGTRKNDATYFRVIRAHFGDDSADQIDEDYWDTWVRTKGRRLNRSLSDIAKYLSKVLTYGYSKGYLRRKPKIKNPDKAKKTGLIYENSDIERFLDYADPLLRDLIILGAECGLRPHENRGLRWEWVEMTEESVFLHLPATFTKTKKPRSIVVSSNSAEILKRRYKERVGPFVYPAPKDDNKPVRREYVAKLWRKMLKKSGSMQGIKFHWLRHSFFTRALLDAKLPIAEVSQYGGNSVRILTERYLQDDPNRTRDVSKAVQLNLGNKN